MRLELNLQHNDAVWVFTEAWGDPVYSLMFCKVKAYKNGANFWATLYTASQQKVCFFIFATTFPTEKQFK